MCVYVCMRVHAHVKSQGRRPCQQVPPCDLKLQGLEAVVWSLDGCFLAIAKKGGRQAGGHLCHGSGEVMSAFYLQWVAVTLGSISQR